MNFLNNVYLLLAVLSLGCFRGFYVVTVSRELLCVWRMGWSCGSSVCCRSWLQGTPALVAAARGLSSRGSRAPEHMLTSCGAVASLRGGVWDPLGLETEPVSPALAGRFLSTVPPGKSGRVWFRERARPGQFTNLQDSRNCSFIPFAILSQR